MVRYYQSFNNRTNAWVKYKIKSDGKSEIVNVKQKEPTKKFKGVQIK